MAQNSRSLQTEASPARSLRRHALRPRKGLGQHFLVNRGALLKIVDAADVHPRDTIIEVGPGTGVLTRELVTRAGMVIAIEKDAALAETLRHDLISAQNLLILTGDMLGLDPAALLADAGATGPYKVVANLPYYAANPILRTFLESAARPACMVVLLQREVAAQITAKPGAMSVLSIAVQLYATPAIAGVIKPGSFYPPPKVDSAIVRLDVRSRPAVVDESETQAFMDVVKAGFSARRKQVANTLAHGLGLPREKVVAALAAAAIDGQRRAETLSLDEWGALYRALRRTA